LQRLLTHSYSGKVLAVRRVTENTGKRTSGVDGEIWNTPEKKSKRGLRGVLINAADYAAGRDFCPASSAARFHGSSSSMRLTGWSAIRESTSRR